MMNGLDLTTFATAVLSLVLFEHLASFTTASGSLVSNCVEPTGLGSGDSDYYNISQLSNVPIGEIFLQGIVFQNIRFGNPAAEQETAIQIRDATLQASKRWNILSAYEENVLEFFGREEISNLRRRCQPDDNASDEELLLFTYHRTVSFAYNIYLIYYFEKPQNLDVFTETYFDVWGLDDDICDWDVSLSDSMDGLSEKNSINGCNDVSTPWGLAYITTREVVEYSIYDGWNADGSYNREYNKIPYMDFRDSNRRYIPVNTPWKLKYKTRYQNLLETDELGFLYYHEHNVPHIGYTGQSYYFTNSEFCHRSKKQGGDNILPNYDYDEEIELTLNRLTQLTEKEKMEIEFFDNKNNLLGPVSTFVQSRFDVDRDSMEWLIGNLVSLHTWYEGILAVWKEKVDFDCVRPPSIIHATIGDQMITSYAGTTSDGESFGTQTFFGRDWEPYIRTMPHSEYPSASACICSAWAEVMELLYGSDNFTDTIGFKLSRTYEAFSSDYEPLSTPSSDLTLEWNSWQELSDRCGESRLEGGMHCTKSVPAGVTLCKGIGTRVVNYINQLLRGIKPRYTVDIQNTDITQFESLRDCYPDRDHDHSSSSSSHD